MVFMIKKRDAIQNACWKPSADIASRKVADEVVLLNVRTSDYYSMNPTAVLVWELLSKKSKFEDIVNSVAVKFNADGGKVKKDVLELIKKLELEKLIIRI
jgi:hypothetical protein